MALNFIPIAQANGQPGAGGCSSAASCSSASSACGSGGCGSSSADDPETKLMAQGFVRRTTIGEPRLSEVVENYKAMGYEVHVEYFGDVGSGTAADEGGSGCTTCFDAADRNDEKQVWGTVYVRQGQTTGKKDDELF